MWEPRPAPHQWHPWECWHHRVVLQIQQVRARSPTANWLTQLSKGLLCASRLSTWTEGSPVLTISTYSCRHFSPFTDVNLLPEWDYTMHTDLQVASPASPHVIPVFTAVHIHPEKLPSPILGDRVLLHDLFHTGRHLCCFSFSPLKANLPPYSLFLHLCISIYFFRINPQTCNRWVWFFKNAFESEPWYWTCIVFFFSSSSSFFSPSSCSIICLKTCQCISSVDLV